MHLFQSGELEMKKESNVNIISKSFSRIFLGTCDETTDRKLFQRKLWLGISATWVLDILGPKDWCTLRNLYIGFLTNNGQQTNI